ncbi:MAG: hypothetical protein DRH24_02455 [Deltaproteobacteria bacterium]|nr:MAG: hypothetical protein DRH24_02455 [Deltaproteobacteria bacterium]
MRILLTSAEDRGIKERVLKQALMAIGHPSNLVCTFACLPQAGMLLFAWFPCSSAGTCMVCIPAQERGNENR